MSRLPSILSNIFDTGEVDPESRNRFLLVAGISTVVVFALALIAVGYYVDNIASRGDTVLTVGERKFSYAYVEDRIDALIADQPFAASQAEAVISTVISQIQSEELTRLVARDREVSVSREELDAGLRERVGATPETPRNDFARLLREELVSQRMSLERLEEIVEAELLRDKIRAALDAELPAEAEQVDLLIIQVATEGEALAARDRILAGEDFGTVATEVSAHSTAQVGGALGWTPRGALPEDVESAAFSLEPGTFSDVLSDENGYFLLKVQDKQTRELDPATRDRLVSQDYRELLSQAQETHGIENSITTRQVQDLVNHIRRSAGA